MFGEGLFWEGPFSEGVQTALKPIDPESRLEGGRARIYLAARYGFQSAERRIPSHNAMAAISVVTIYSSMSGMAPLSVDQFGST